ncbi:MAG: response regulator [Acidobacteriota bacterium]
MVIWAAMPKKDSQDDLPCGSELILLVEDEDGVRSLAEKILRRFGYQVLSAGNRKQAEELFAHNAEQIDLLFTDVVMPDCSGIELYDSLVAKRSSLKVLYMSGYPDIGVKRGRTRSPGAPFLYKPFTPDALARQIREVLDS